jgi:hypothetical protein
MTQSMKSLPMSNEIFAKWIPWRMKYLPMSNEIFNDISAVENEILNEIHTDEQ